MEYDAALLSLLAAAVTRRPVLLAGAVPWLRSRSRIARRRTGTRRPRRPLPPFVGEVAVRLAQEAAADTVGFIALARGSAQHRRPVL